MAAAVEEPVATGDSGSAAEEVKPYRIHVSFLLESLSHIDQSVNWWLIFLVSSLQVSSRYLNLTKQKLEIARLPHELDEPKSKDWWQPKPQVEPLIDFWLVTRHLSSFLCLSCACLVFKSQRVIHHRQY